MKIHIFHKWEAESHDSVNVTVGRFGRSAEVDGLLIIRKCAVCGKRDAFVKILDGTCLDVDIDVADSMRRNAGK